MENFFSPIHILYIVLFLIIAPIFLTFLYKRLRKILLEKVVYKDNPELEQKRKRRELLEVKIIYIGFLVYWVGFCMYGLIFNW